jgi:acyl-CoA thioesterase
MFRCYQSGSLGCILAQALLAGTQQVEFSERLRTDAKLLAGLGIEFVGASAGKVELSLDVTAARVNGQQFCHGGYLFALADTACAYVLGAAGHSPATVDANITYLKPAKVGDRVLASASLLSLGRRQGVAQVRLTRSADAVLLAVFRGTCVNLRKLNDRG